MTKKVKIIIAILIVIILLAISLFLIYPNIEFKKNGKFYACRLSGDFSEFEENASYGELYFYNEKNDISLKNFEVKNFLCFYVFSFDYIEGDFRETQFVLEKSYIKNFLANAEITDNSNNIDLAKLIEGKKAIVGNKRYLGNEYDNGIFYKLDGKYEEMYIFYVDDLLVIQVGSPDELPKYIAYK